MEVILNDIDDLNEEMFKDALKVVGETHKVKYKFILRGGKALHTALFELFSIVWRTEKIPESWKETELIQIPKSKEKDNLEMFRHIHLKTETPKLFQQIVISAAKENLIKNMSKFQIAAKPGHRASEHVFCIMSMMLANEKK